jgi:hypothetical protein
MADFSHHSQWLIIIDNGHFHALDHTCRAEVHLKNSQYLEKCCNKYLLQTTQMLKSKKAPKSHSK